MSREQINQTGIRRTTDGHYQRFHSIRLDPDYTGQHEPSGFPNVADTEEQGGWEMYDPVGRGHPCASRVVHESV
jgi:hypothetical protein